MNNNSRNSNLLTKNKNIRKERYKRLNSNMGTEISSKLFNKK